MFSGGLFLIACLSIFAAVVTTVMAYNMFSNNVCFINATVWSIIAIFLMSLAFTFDSFTHLYAWMKYDDVKCWTFTNMFHDSESLNNALDRVKASRIVHYYEGNARDCNGKHLYNYIRVITADDKSKNIDEAYKNIIGK